MLHITRIACNMGRMNINPSIGVVMVRSPGPQRQARLVALSFGCCNGVRLIEGPALNYSHGFDLPTIATIQ